MPPEGDLDDLVTFTPVREPADAPASVARPVPTAPAAQAPAAQAPAGPAHALQVARVKRRTPWGVRLVSGLAWACAFVTGAFGVGSFLIMPERVLPLGVLCLVAGAGFAALALGLGRLRPWARVAALALAAALGTGALWDLARLQVHAVAPLALALTVIAYLWPRGGLFSRTARPAAQAA